MAYSYQIMEIKHGNVYVPADDIERLTELQDIGYKHAQIGYEAFVDIATYFLRHMRLSIPRASFKDKVTQKEQNHYNLSNETYLRREIALTLIEQSKI